MDIAIITGSAGLIGSEATEFFAEKGFTVVGIDNDLRRYFFGAEGSTDWNAQRLQKEAPRYRHVNSDIRDYGAVEKIFREYSTDIKVVIHTAAQPSHDWAAKEPRTDFSVNADGTLNLLELTRLHAPQAVFIFTSSNKVYGDRPNALPLVEQESRWEIAPGHPYHDGIDETMPIDACQHSLFGASKLAADIMVQEYGRYFGMKTVSFRGGCMTGPKHSVAMMHGFLAYLMKCCVTGQPYTIFGYKGKQVRDNIHSHDLASAFYCFYLHPRPGEVYNMGGGRQNSCSVLEAMELCHKIVGRPIQMTYDEHNRAGDHIWYISGLKKFEAHYPQWQQQYSLEQTLHQIYDHNRDRWIKAT